MGVGGLGGGEEGRSPTAGAPTRAATSLGSTNTWTGATTHVHGQTSTSCLWLDPN